MANPVREKTTVLVGGTKAFMASVTDWDALPITVATITAAEYTVYLLDENDPNERTVVEGHDGVTLTVADVVLDAPVVGPGWTRDAVGYNLLHTIDISTHAAFALLGRTYHVDFVLTPASGQAILVGFEVRTV